MLAMHRSSVIAPVLTYPVPGPPELYCGPGGRLAPKHVGRRVVGREGWVSSRRRLGLIAGGQNGDAACRGEVSARGMEACRSPVPAYPDAAEIPAGVSNFEQVAAG